MAAGVTRDDDALRRGVRDWVSCHRPEHSDIVVDDLTRPAAGWSNETVIVSISWRIDAGRARERLVFRLPPPLASFPTYELHDQERVLAALAHSCVAVPRVIAVEDDATWLGAPFLVMSFVDGKPGGEIPALDPWLKAAPADRQRAVHEGFLAALASVHQVDWRATALDGSLRVGMRAELDYWTRYVHWAAAPDAPPHALIKALDWCASTAPDDTRTMSLLWGDARIGNVMYGPEGDVVGLLDWELATIGPAEMDLGWYLVLDELTTHFVRASVPGFLGREAAIEYYERALGRPVAHLAWHEVFALVRSIAISDRQARIAAASGTSYPGIAGDANPMLRHLDARIASFDG
ncbi:MAG: aminoglycoside phosphotransferase [Actinomycetia bacterium]|nr:aminoglycoside phosphotransferase [Actinomycetes bacterium]